MFRLSQSSTIPRRVVGRTRWRATAALALLFVGAPLAFAVQGDFSEIGDVAYKFGKPQAGRMNAVVPVPATGHNTIFAISPQGGLWKTIDGGNHWDPLLDRGSSLFFFALAVDATGSEVYAATFYPTRLLKSTDGGNSFTEIVIPLLAYQHQWIGELVIDPAHPGTVYALTSRGLMRSINGGINWSVVLPKTPAGNVGSVEILAGDQSHVLATRGGILYRSSNGASGSFVQIPLPAPPDGLPASDSALPILFLAAVPGQPWRVYMAYREEGGAIYRSDNYGLAPVFTSRHPERINSGKLVASADGTTLYTGDRENGNYLVQRGRNGGQDWDIPFSGPYHADIEGLTTTASPGYLYVATDGGLWRMHEQTQEWENLNGDLRTLLLYAAHASRSDKNQIVAGTQDNGVVLHRGVQWNIGVSGDAGEGYLRADNPNLGAAIEMISGSLLLDINGNKAFKNVSGDEPDPNACPDPSTGVFAVDPTNPLLVCDAFNKVVCSYTGGNNDDWCAETADMGARHLTIVDQDHAWVGAVDGKVYRTTNGVMGNWQDVTGNMPSTKILGLDAPEGGDPQRAVVLIRDPANVPRVYDTTDGGQTWQQLGVPPLPEIAGPESPCTIEPCPTLPEAIPFLTTFGVTFPGVLFTESWFVGTSHGLLESDDFGQTWENTNLPHVQIADIDTFGGVVTVATHGRGLWRRQTVSQTPAEGLLRFDKFWWLNNSPVEQALWASDLIATSGGLLNEVRSTAGPGQAFRLGDVAQGPFDFRITSGLPFMMQSARPGEIPVSGPAAEAYALALSGGWNPIGFAGAGPPTASALIADAASQGVQLAAVMDGITGEVFLPQAEAGRGSDFEVDPTHGYWALACGDGGSWTPGRVEFADRGPGSEAPRFGMTEAEDCPNAGEILSRMPSDISMQLPAEVLVCVPEQLVEDGGETYSICDTAPAPESDKTLEHIPCVDQHLNRGCVVTASVTHIAGKHPTFDFSFDARARGTATKADGTTCLIDARAEGGSFSAEVNSVVDPPVVHHEVGHFSDFHADFEQYGCGRAVDQAIAEAIAEATEAAFAEEVGRGVRGLGPVCDPAIDLSPIDADGDGTIDCNDGCPSDPAKTAPGLCGCGVVEIDEDGDGVPSCLPDCDDTDAAVWTTPGEAQSLVVDHDPVLGVSTLQWLAPDFPGAVGHRYDVLRSSDPGDFLVGAECVQVDDVDPVFPSGLNPLSGEIWHYLVRARNDCPTDPLGSLGSDSAGVERPGISCGP